MTSTTTKYYNAGLVKAIAGNGAWSYLVQNALGSVSEHLGTSGTVKGQQRYYPYGISDRYVSGYFTTNHGYTDQYHESDSGLHYYGARYYDPVVGQFVSGDTVQGPNRYGYVNGNPEMLIDPPGIAVVIIGLVAQLVQWERLYLPVCLALPLMLVGLPLRRVV